MPRILASTSIFSSTVSVPEFVIPLVAVVIISKLLALKIPLFCKSPITALLTVIVAPLPLKTVLLCSSSPNVVTVIVALFVN